MSLVIFVFGIRFILYYFVVNPWYFLPIELTSGFTFGIFYSVMTSYASIIAPAGTHATMQGLVGAAFEGLGKLFFLINGFSLKEVANMELNHTPSILISTRGEKGVKGISNFRYYTA